MKLNPTFTSWLVTLTALALGLFFVYAGGKKVFLPPAPRGGGDSAVPQAFIDLVRALKAAGYYMDMVGWMQFISGILLLIRPLRLVGALMLIPITFNIFMIHILLDDRVGEFVFTGILLLANATIILYHGKQLILRAPLKEETVQV